MSVRPHPQQKTKEKYSSTWLIDFYDAEGKRHKLQFEGREEDAWKQENELRINSFANKKTGAYPTLKRAAGDFIEWYKVDHLPGGVSWAKIVVKHLVRHMGHYQFAAITDQVILRYKTGRKEEGVSPNTINKELALLSTMLKWASEYKWCQPIKIKRFPKKMTKSPVPEVPTRKEALTLLRAIPRRKRKIFALMYYLGLRTAEARGIKSSDINLELKIVVVRGKGNKQRIIPLNRKSLPFLRSGGFPVEAPKDLREIILWAKKRTSINVHITPHKLRHAFGVHMTLQGASIRALQMIMGHESVKTTEIYTHLATTQLAAEMDKF